MFIEIVYATQEAHETASNPAAVLGLDWKLFIAQIINFAIVLFVLWKWAYKPLVKKLNERTAKIAKGLQEAAAATQNLAAAETQKEAKILAAKKEAGLILKKANQGAARQRELILTETKQKTEAIVVQARELIQQEKVKIVKEAKTEVAGLVVEATEKILGQTVTAEIDKSLVEETLKSIKKS